MPGYAVINKKEAQEDILEAVTWYELQQKGLGIKFLDEFEEIIEYLHRNPFLFPEKYPPIHQVPLKRFPFAVLYSISGRNVFIHAVFHCKRDPKKKNTRFEK